MTSSSQDALDAIDRAVFSSSEPIVIALTGGWGEGKTWFWKNRVTAKDRLPPQKKRPGYVSVFGADSMMVIRERVALAGLRSSSFAEKVPAAITNKLAPLFSALKNVVGEKIGLSDSLAVELLQDQGLEEGWTVCIDDVERLSVDVGFDKFLGYISELRDEWHIKVVLIYNSEVLANDENDHAFHQYREKVIDREIPFIADQTHLVTVAFGQIKAPGFDVVQFVTEKSATLGLRNIRILVKAREYLKDILRVLGPQLGDDFLRAAITGLLLSCFVKFSNLRPPRLTFAMLANYSELVDQLRESAGIDKEVVETWPEKTLLTKLGYLYTDDFDKFLMRFVETDILDESQLRERYEKFQEDVRKAALDADFMKVWDTHYHGTLRDNSNELCCALVAALSPCLQFVSINSLDFALHILKSLNRADDAHRLFTEFKRIREPILEKLAPHDLQPMEKLQYEPLREWINLLSRKREKDERTLADIMGTAFDREFVSSADATKLAEFTTTDFVNFLMTNDQPYLTSRMRSLMQVPNEALRQTIGDAAMIIANSHTLNRMRMEGMGFRAKQH